MTPAKVWIMGAAWVAALFASTGAIATPPPIMGATQVHLMSWADLLNRPRPKPTRSIFYGDNPNQLAELWLPAGPGPHPVVVLIHGGCWEAATATHSYLDYAAEDLRRRGLAVYNIEYRSVDQPGGGYPGTFQDVAAAIDRLGIEAPKAALTTRHLVVVGHSAGGQLALWAAGRGRISKSSPLHWAAPQAVYGVVDIAGIPNLKTDTHTACGGGDIAKLVGQPNPTRPDVYSDTSPAALLPLGVPQVVIHGAQDHTVPLAVGEAYARAARAKGDTVVVHSPPGAHVEEVTPGQPAWEAAAADIVALAHGEPAP